MAKRVTGSNSRIILASASPRRIDLLGQLGVKFDVAPPAVEELSPAHLTPEEICQINAYRKARAAAKKNPDAMVIGADTIVCLGTDIYGKPKSQAEAARMLTRLQGRTHLVLTGVCLLHLRAHHQKLFAVSTAVTFRQLHPKQIRSYLSKIDPLDKAGAYAIQEEGDEIVRAVAGSYTNVVGLPLERLREELTACGLAAR
jgi:septum formation protein